MDITTQLILIYLFIFQVIIACTILCTFWKNGAEMIPVVGEIPRGLPIPVLPNVSLWPSLLTPVLPIGFYFVPRSIRLTPLLAVISYCTTLSLGKTFGNKENFIYQYRQRLIYFPKPLCTTGLEKCQSLTAVQNKRQVKEILSGNTKGMKISRQ